MHAVSQTCVTITLLGWFSLTVGNKIEELSSETSDVLSLVILPCSLKDCRYHDHATCVGCLVFFVVKAQLPKLEIKSRNQTQQKKYQEIKDVYVSCLTKEAFALRSSVQSLEVGVGVPASVWDHFFQSPTLHAAWQEHIYDNFSGPAPCNVERHTWII